MLDAPAAEGLIAFAEPRTLLEVDLADADVRMLIDGAEPLADRSHVARFIIADRGTNAAALVGPLRFDSTAQFLFPSTDLDSEDLYPLEVSFYLDEELAVLVTGDGSIPRRVLVEVAVGMAFEIESKPPNELTNVADDARFVVLRVLQQRVRDIEASVRKALDDEHVSPEDYAALREYPGRLARVERLAFSLPKPTWQAAQADRYSHLIAPDNLGKWIREVGDEAREAVARLSGLIASQSVVVAQRQAAETERFQRLLTLVGTTVLVPGLVAGVFGANVDIPGRDSRDGFYALLLLMIASAAASYALLRSFQQDVWSKLVRRLGIERSREGSEYRHLVVAVAVAIVATGWAIMVLIWD